MIFFRSSTVIQDLHVESFRLFSNCFSNIPKTNNAQSGTSNLLYRLEYLYFLLNWKHKW